jgi:hypothetical protein
MKSGLAKRLTEDLVKEVALQKQVSEMAVLLGALTTRVEELETKNDFILRALDSLTMKNIQQGLVVQGLSDNIKSMSREVYGGGAVDL